MSLHQVQGSGLLIGTSILSLLLTLYGGAFLYPVGLALLFGCLAQIEDAKKRALFGFLWYVALSGVQLSWSFGHPYLYIFVAYALHLILLGGQFALLSLFVTKKNIEKLSGLFALAGGWTLLEWSRLFFFNGHPWHPFGLLLAGNDASRQLAALIGVYGMTFFVVVVSLLALRFWLFRRGAVLLAALYLLPFLYGYVRLQEPLKSEKSLKTLLVQTAFPIEESLGLSYQELRELVSWEWSEIVRLLRESQGEKPELIVLPELVVPFGTYYLVFGYDEVEKAFGDLPLPPLYPYFSREIDGENRINNAYWLFAIASVFQSDLIAGLEDRDEKGVFTSAFLVQPNTPFFQRYEKQLLVPMGEYIPFSQLRELAKSYGITGSFTPGDRCKILEGAVHYGPSICFEEAIGHLMCGYKESDLLVNLTNDGWFPGWGLPRVHLEHGRMRAVELGIPLVRACNTGVTAAIDPYGRILAKLGDSEHEEETVRGVLSVDVPLVKIETLYSLFGDWLALSIAALSLLFRLKFNN